MDSYQNLLIGVITRLSMVIILDGKLEIGVHLWINVGYWICLRPLLRSKEVKNQIICQKRSIFRHSCAIYVELPSNISNMLRPMGRSKF